MSEDDLKAFIQSNYGPLGSLGSLFSSSLPYEKRNNIERAEKILQEKAVEKEKQQKKSLDDGSVRGLILSGEYSEVGRSVYIQNLTGDTAIWTKSVYGYPSTYDYTTYVFRKNDSEWSDVEKTAQNVVTICRRKLKKKILS